MQSSESDIELDTNEIVTSKTFVCTVRYYYDAEDNLVRKHIKFADGEEHTVLYEQASKGYRLHTISTANGGSKGLGGCDRIQATMVFEKI